MAAANQHTLKASQPSASLRPADSTDHHSPVEGPLPPLQRISFMVRSPLYTSTHAHATRTQHPCTRNGAQPPRSSRLMSPTASIDTCTKASNSPSAAARAAAEVTPRSQQQQHRAETAPRPRRDRAEIAPRSPRDKVIITEPGARVLSPATPSAPLNETASLWASHCPLARMIQRRSTPPSAGCLQRIHTH